MLPSLSASLLAGLLGSPHCIGMCGGLAGACSGGSSGSAAGQAAWHAGRLSTYAFLGALAGAFGSFIPGPSWVPGILSVGLLTWFALALAGVVPEPKLRFPGAVKLGTSAIQRPGIWGRYLFGISTGFLPCGLIYAALAIPVASGSAWIGAASMVAFGLGTVPALVFLTAGVRKLVSRDLRIRRAVAAGVFLLALGSMAMRQGLVPEFLHGMGSHSGHGAHAAPAAMDGGSAQPHLHPIEGQ